MEYACLHAVRNWRSQFQLTRLPLNCGTVQSGNIVPHFLSTQTQSLAYDVLRTSPRSIVLASCIASGKPMSAVGLKLAVRDGLTGKPLRLSLDYNTLGEDPEPWS